MVKVFLTVAGATLVGAYIEPKITPYLPSAINNATTSKFVHASISGLTGVGIWWGLSKAGVKATGA